MNNFHKMRDLLEEFRSGQAHGGLFSEANGYGGFRLIPGLTFKAFLGQHEGKVVLTREFDHQFNLFQAYIEGGKDGYWLVLTGSAKCMGMISVNVNATTEMMEVLLYSF